MFAGIILCICPPSGLTLTGFIPGGAEPGALFPNPPPPFDGVFRIIGGKFMTLLLLSLGNIGN